MKIVCVGYLHGAGGAERQIIMLANEMASRGHNVYLLVMCKFGSKYAINSNVNIIDITDAERNRFPIVHRYFALKKELTKIRPDITVAYWLQTVYFCALMSKSITGKVVYSERGDPFDKEYDGLLGIVRWLSFNRTDGFVFQSKGASVCFSEEIRSKSVIINNAVTKDVYKYKNPAINRTKRIVTVGRLSPQKNQALLIEAFAKIAANLPEYVLEIYGEGELKEKLQNQVMKLDLKDRVVFKGTSRNILECIYDAALFVLSSDYEGMPNALMEAYCLGIPCISTDCRPGGAREILNSGYDGIIVPCNDVEELSSVIMNILSKQDYARNFEKNAFKRRKKFNSDAVYDKWENYIKIVLTF